MTCRGINGTPLLPAIAKPLLTTSITPIKKHPPITIIASPQNTTAHAAATFVREGAGVA